MSESVRGLVQKTQTQESAKAATVTLIVPTLNEIEGMRVIMPRIDKKWFDQILVVDGGSTDGTVEYALQNGYAVVRQKRRGMRRAYLDLLPQITGDVVITFSPDGNSIPELLPALTAKMKEGYDMVIVSRYLDGAKSDDDTSFTKFANEVFTLLTNAFFGSRYTDSMVIYRAYYKKLIGLLELDKDDPYYVPEKMFGTIMSWELLLSIRAAKVRLRVAEIPGDEPSRVAGGKKTHYKWGLAYVLQVFMEVLVWRRNPSYLTS